MVQSKTLADHHAEQVSTQANDQDLSCSVGNGSVNDSFEIDEVHDKLPAIHNEDQEILEHEASHPGDAAILPDGASSRVSTMPPFTSVVSKANSC